MMCTLDGLSYKMCTLDGVRVEIPLGGDTLDPAQLAAFQDE